MAKRLDKCVRLSSLAIGSRLVVRSKADWRYAAISRISDERVTITVCSPSGRTYRLWRKIDAEIAVEGGVPILTNEAADNWRENFSRYDYRW